MTLSAIVFLLIWISLSAFSYYKEDMNHRNIYNGIVNACLDNPNYIPDCSEYINDKYTSPDTVTMFFYILTNSSLNLIQIIAPLFLIIPSVYMFQKKLKTGFFKNYLLRTTYKKYILSNYLNSLKNVIIFPIALLFLFFCCYLISGHFNYNEFIPMLFVNVKFMNNIPLFMIVYFINIILFSVFCINLGLFFSKKSNNVIINAISAFITFVLLDLFLEIFIGGFVAWRILKIKGAVSLLNLFGIWIYSDYSDLVGITLYSIFLAVLSTLIIYFRYKNKEDVVICSES